MIEIAPKRNVRPIRISMRERSKPTGYRPRKASVASTPRNQNAITPRSEMLPKNTLAVPEIQPLPNFELSVSSNKRVNQRSRGGLSWFNTGSALQHDVVFQVAMAVDSNRSRRLFPANLFRGNNKRFRGSIDSRANLVADLSSLCSGRSVDAGAPASGTARSASTNFRCHP